MNKNTTRTKGVDTSERMPRRRQPAVLTEKAAGRAIRELLGNRRDELSSLTPSPEAVEDSARKLNLARHYKQMGKEANAVATYFARLPDDIRESIIELLNGPTIATDENHFAAIKALFLESLNWSRNGNGNGKRRKRPIYIWPGRASDYDGHPIDCEPLVTGKEVGL